MKVQASLNLHFPLFVEDQDSAAVWLRTGHYWLPGMRKKKPLIKLMMNLWKFIICCNGTAITFIFIYVHPGRGGVVPKYLFVVVIAAPPGGKHTHTRSVRKRRKGGILTVYRLFSTYNISPPIIRSISALSIWWRPVWSVLKWPTCRALGRSWAGGYPIVYGIDMHAHLQCVSNMIYSNLSSIMTYRGMTWAKRQLLLFFCSCPLEDGKGVWFAQGAWIDLRWLQLF